MKKIATALLLICTAAFAQQQGSFTDSRDGKKYKTTKIGSQVWMAENLNYETSGSKCGVNKPENCDKYGRLYTSDVAMKACPSGWHLPTIAEWDILVNFAGGEETAGKQLKAKSGWKDDKGKSGNGEDKFGFAALPGGFSMSVTSFSIGIGSFWWSASERGDGKFYYWRVVSYNEDARSSYNDNKYFYSVRCLQGSEPSQTQTNSSTAFVLQQGSFTDSRDGKKYKTTKIGSQVWMAENLNYNASGSKCYDNKPENCDKYGKLYDWNTAKNACPTGWHLPSKDEAQTLKGYVEKDKGCSKCGDYLKATSGWLGYNGTDDYGFAALQGGFYSKSNGFKDWGGYWWTATYIGWDNFTGYNMELGSERNRLFGINFGKDEMYSVRCVQGNAPEYANKNSQAPTNNAPANTGKSQESPSKLETTITPTNNVPANTGKSQESPSKLETTVKILEALSGAAKDFSESYNSIYGIGNQPNTYNQPSQNSQPAKGNDPSKLRYKQQDEKTYENYTNMLMNMNYNYTTYSDINRRSYQSTMKQLRMKWVNQGYSFWKSDWEDWDGRKK